MKKIIFISTFILSIIIVAIGCSDTYATPAVSPPSIIPGFYNTTYYFGDVSKIYAKIISDVLASGDPAQVATMTTIVKTLTRNEYGLESFLAGLNKGTLVINNASAPDHNYTINRGIKESNNYQESKGGSGREDSIKVTITDTSNPTKIITYTRYQIIRCANYPDETIIEDRDVPHPPDPDPVSEQSNCDCVKDETKPRILPLPANKPAPTEPIAQPAIGFASAIAINTPIEISFGDSNIPQLAGEENDIVAMSSEQRQYYTQETNSLIWAKPGDIIQIQTDAQYANIPGYPPPPSPPNYPKQDHPSDVPDPRKVIAEDVGKIYKGSATASPVFASFTWEPIYTKHTVNYKALENKTTKCTYICQKTSASRCGYKLDEDGLPTKQAATCYVDCEKTCPYIYDWEPINADPGYISGWTAVPLYSGTVTKTAEIRIQANYCISLDGIKYLEWPCVWNSRGGGDDDNGRGDDDNTPGDDDDSSRGDDDNRPGDDDDDDDDGANPPPSEPCTALFPPRCVDWPNDDVRYAGEELTLSHSVTVAPRENEQFNAEYFATLTKELGTLQAKRSELLTQISELEAAIEKLENSTPEELENITPEALQSQLDGLKFRLESTKANLQAQETKIADQERKMQLIRDSRTYATSTITGTTYEIISFVTTPDAAKPGDAGIGTTSSSTPGIPGSSCDHYTKPDTNNYRSIGLARDCIVVQRQTNTYFNTTDKSNNPGVVLEGKTDTQACNVSGTGCVSLSPTIIIDDLPPGSKICTAISVWPSTSHDTPGATGLDRNFQGGKWAYGAPTCYTIAKKPSTQFWGGGLYSAAGITTSQSIKYIPDTGYFTAGQCTGNPSVVTGTCPNQGNNGLIGNASKRYAFGSWNEYEVISDGAIKGIGSGASLGYSGPSNLSFAGGKPIVTDGNPGGFPTTDTNFAKTKTCTYSRQTIANSDNGKCTNGSTTLGEPKVTTTTFLTIQRIISRYYTAPCVEKIGTLNAITIGSTRYCSRSGDDIVHSYAADSDQVTLYAPAPIPQGHTITISVPDKLTIADDIIYENTTYDDIAHLPQVIIIAGSIEILPKVKQIDAWLIVGQHNAKATSTGILNTCTGFTVGSPNLAEGGLGGNGGIPANPCTTPLTINGPVFAEQFLLNRIGGAGQGNDSITPAELFNLRADSYLWGYAEAQRYSQAVVTYTRELAPRF